jgi:hypothetical protein
VKHPISKFLPGWEDFVCFEKKIVKHSIFHKFLLHKFTPGWEDFVCFEKIVEPAVAIAMQKVFRSTDGPQTEEGADEVEITHKTKQYKPPPPPCIK